MQITVPGGTTLAPEVTYTAPFPRLGDSAILTFQCSAFRGSGKVAVQVEHKNLSETAFTAVTGATVDINSEGVESIVTSSENRLKEVVRLAFTNDSEHSARIEILPPNFFDQQL